MFPGMLLNSGIAWCWWGCRLSPTLCCSSNVSSEVWYLLSQLMILLHLSKIFFCPHQECLWYFFTVNYHFHVEGICFKRIFWKTSWLSTSHVNFVFLSLWTSSMSSLLGEPLSFRMAIFCPVLLSENYVLRYTMKNSSINMN